jgi:hypothetical protein
MKTISSIYNGQQIMLATMHAKEQYLEAACRKILGAELVTCKGNLNTDQLGTFSGEVERKGTQKEVVVQKCKLGMNISKIPLGLANEGSFGPHPLIPFAAASYETMVFIDQKRNIQVFETKFFSSTNYNYKIASIEDDVSDFLKNSIFPSHGVIVRPNIWNDKSIIFKGIQDYENLQKAIIASAHYSCDKLVRLETDMRAHMNPTRGRNIRKLGILLFRRLTCLCPSCKAPGWGKTDILRGRLCQLCQCPTDLPISYVWSCPLCPYREEKPFSASIEYTDPQYCALCNP